MNPTPLDPLSLRDFRKGRVSKNQVSNLLAPENSVANSLNVNFDEIIGAAKVRPGTTKLGDVVLADGIPRGLASFVGQGGTPDLLLAVFSDTGQSHLNFYDNNTEVWAEAATYSGLDPDVKNRFAVLGGRAFITNEVNGMQDSANGNIWGVVNSIASYFPSLVFRYKARLLAGGDPSLPSRIFFSSIIDPVASPFITWNTDPTTGDWIDINPDDGGRLVGFSESSTFCLVFKDTGFYRLDTVSKTADAENINNIGATSQEAIVLCGGATYYFSGLGVHRTNGGYPELLSRTAVQDFINAIPRDNWEDVCGGTDGLNVYFSIGDVTVNNRDYVNIVLKYSPNDEAWSIHSYSKKFKFFSPFITTALAL